MYAVLLLLLWLLSQSPGFHPLISVQVSQPNTLIDCLAHTARPEFLHLSTEKPILINDDLNSSSESTHTRTKRNDGLLRLCQLLQSVLKRSWWLEGRKLIWKLGLCKTLCGHGKLLKLIVWSIQNHNYGSTRELSVDFLLEIQNTEF